MARSSKESIVRAVDIGYGNTKFITDDVGNAYDHFRSLAVPARPAHRHEDIVSRRQTIRVFVGDQEFEVGPGTCDSTRAPELHQDYIDTNQHRALYYGALARMGVRDIDVLVTGLPVTQHQSHADRMRERLIGEHQISSKLVVKVRDVIVVPQPLGAFVSHAFLSNFTQRTGNRPNLLIDVGYYTFDWMVASGLTQSREISGSVAIGMSAYVNEVADSYASHTGTTDPGLIRDIDLGLRTGDFFESGQRVDLGPYKEKAKHVLKDAIAHMRYKIGAATRIHEIFIAGGGAHLFADELREQYKNHTVSIVSDPMYANVRGFQFIGRTMIEQQAAAG